MSQGSRRANMGSAPLSLVYERRHLSRSQEGDAYVAVDQKELLADLDAGSNVQSPSSVSSERIRSRIEALSQTSAHRRFDKMS